MRSVNAKGLDLRLRLPPGFDVLEADLRKLLSARFARGAIQASLVYERDFAALVPVINEAALNALIASTEALRQRLGSPPPAAEALLAIKGVMELREAEQDSEMVAVRNLEILTGLERAAGELAAARLQEGAALGALLLAQIGEIARLTAAIEADPSRSPAAIRERLVKQLTPILDDAAALEPQRLYQEAALLASKADIREEIDRLQTHVAAARILLVDGGPVGRKLDFLAQEFNRECNTICSKSNAAALTALGLEMKAVIDQFREQVQNLE